GRAVMVSAAGVTPVCGGARAGILSSVLAAPDDSAAIALENETQQLRFSPPRAPLAFQSFLRAAGEWKPSTLPDTPIVSGASFPLVSSAIRREGSVVLAEGKASAQGLDGKVLEYTWNTEIHAQANQQAP